jgi:predicted MFS family arabinose efflux permease
MGIGIVAATCFGLAAPLSADVGTLLTLRLLEGVALGAVPAVALVYLSEEVERRSVAAAAGSYIAGTTVGGLLGRVLSGLVAELGDWRLGLGSTALVCALSAAVFLWLVPRPRGFSAARGDGEGRSLLQRVLACIGSVPQLALYAQGLLLMGAFVAVYNYLGFHLTADPFLLPAWLVTLLFLAYLAGTASSPLAGALASARGRFPVLLGSIAVMSLGALLLLAPRTPVVLIGLLLFTAGFFGAHAVASGWTPVAAPPGTGSQASSLYYFSYYAGSSLFGWALGIVFGSADWSWFVAGVVAMCAISALLAIVGLRAEPSGRA